MNNSKTIKGVFSKKHTDYIERAKNATISVAEGAVRAGKTIDNIAAFAWMIHNGTPDRIHLATGSTSANAKLNIGDANGFGLEHLFRGRCRWSKYRGNDALIIKSKGQEYVVIFAGGGKADSFKKIRGNSYGMWIATEINLHHTDTIKEAFNRQLAAKNRKVFWDLNPSAPHAPIYEDYIDRFDEQFGEKYNYEHFTIRDNLTISAERLAEIEAQYQKGTVWYRRDILGQRCAAEGLIYKIFADNESDYIVNDTDKWLEDNKTYLRAVTVGVDFGGTGSATKFQATGITGRWDAVALEEEYIDHRKEDVDPDRLIYRYTEFIKRITEKYGASETRADSAEQVLIRGLFNAARQKGLRTRVKNALKMPVRDRIKLELLLMAQRRLFVSADCPHLIDAFRSAVYNPKKTDDERLDDGTSDIDSLDAFEYSVEPYYKQLNLQGFRRENEHSENTERTGI